VENLPLSMSWVPDFVALMNWALLGDVISWTVEDQPDPLRKVLVIRLNRYWTKAEVPHLRVFLRLWCEANDCVYQRSQWEKRDFRALIILKGLGPKRDINPLLG